MLQINNLEGKSDWINETQLIIPIVDNEEISQKEIDGMSKQTITINGLESADQTLLTNGSGQTFVIGLDQALFENYNSKSDLLLMSNSDLKLIPNVPDTKLTYASVDNSKSEIAWENTIEKPLAKDILNVIQDTSKNWQDMGKSGDICFDDIHAVDSKLNADFLIESHVVQSKKLRTDGSDQYIVGYYPVVEACDTVLVPASLMTLQQKKVDNEKSMGKNIISSTRNISQLFENVEDAQTHKWMKSGMEEEGKTTLLKMTNIQENPLILPQHNLNETVIPLINSASSDFIDAKSKNDFNVDTEKCITKDKKLYAGVLENDNNTLLEQSLPLKKKAKMKKSPMSGSFCFPSGNTTANGCHILHKSDVNENEERITVENNKDLDELKRKRKSEVTANCFTKKEKEWCIYQRNEANQNEIHYDNITQLLECLKNKKYINESIFRILSAGLEEMDVDVLDEMYKKRDSKCPDYSSHLKAFALMLHFKQPTAFNRLGELFQSGWPPLSVIKEWKRQLNNHRKPRKAK